MYGGRRIRALDPYVLQREGDRRSHVRRSPRKLPQNQLETMTIVLLKKQTPQRDVDQRVLSKVRLYVNALCSRRLL